MREASAPSPMRGAQSATPHSRSAPSLYPCRKAWSWGSSAQTARRDDPHPCCAWPREANGGESPPFGQDPKALSAAELIALKQHVASACAVCPYPEEYTAGDIVRIEHGLYPAFNLAYLEELLEKFELAQNVRALSGITAKSLSRGQGMKLQIALALASGATLLLLDEPTAGLDPVVRDEALSVLREHLAKTPDTFILISSHITSGLESLADRILLMDAGKLIFAEDADVLEKRFATLALRASDFEERKDALREAGATRCLPALVQASASPDRGQEALCPRLP